MMELAILDVPFSLCLNGIEVVLRGVVVTVNLTVSTTSDGTPDVDGGWIKGEGEVLLLCGGNDLGGDFDDLECCHVRLGGQFEGVQQLKTKRTQGQECEEVVAKAGGEMRRRGFRGADW